ncbi:hypothetical protein BJV74DRAFT_795347 [Russula compacta]|nr:hypothetical protein BJV74DRAFT_795347 [Russula compacta]
MRALRQARSLVCFFCFPWLIRDLAHTVRESDNNKQTSVPRGGVYGDIHDEWGILPHHFQTAIPPREEVTRGGSLKQMRSTPFFSREPRAPVSDPPAIVPSSRPLLPSRHIRKDSKVAQVLGIAGTPENARDDTEPLPNSEGLMSPPILPMEADPFERRQPGAAMVNNRLPATQVPVTHPSALQHVLQPALSMPSLSVPTKRHAAHTHTRSAHTSQSPGGFCVDTATRRAPRPLHRMGYTQVAALSTRSRSNPPPGRSVAGHYANSSQPLHPSRVVNLESESRHEFISTHPIHTVGVVVSLVRNASKSPLKCWIFKHGGAAPPRAQTPERFGKAQCRSSTPNGRIGLREAELFKRSDGIAPVNAVQAPAPALRPPNIAVPPRAEREAYRDVAIETERTRNKISDERALVECGRAGFRASTLAPSQTFGNGGSKRRGREVEYHNMVNYGYYPMNEVGTVGLGGGAW